jgi:glyceraldehyde 3-phosphate dehydrogenase
LKPETKIKVAINGFGRIGRNLFRLLLNHPTIEVVAINDIADAKTMAHLLKYDSIHGVLANVLKRMNEHIFIDGKVIFVFQRAAYSKPELERIAN